MERTRHHLEQSQKGATTTHQGNLGICPPLHASREYCATAIRVGASRYARQEVGAEYRPQHSRRSEKGEGVSHRGSAGTAGRLLCGNRFPACRYTTESPPG